MAKNNDTGFKILVILFLFSIGIVAGISGFGIYQTIGSETEVYSAEASSSDGEESWRKPEKHGLAPIYEPEGPVYKIMKPNVSTWSDSQNTPVYHVRTNSDGFRDEEFEKPPPNNTIRILVIGDSFTYGWGLNESERYSDLTEKKLDSATDSKVQVVTAGTPSWGIKDYYKVLKHRGLSYEPDIVVLGLYKNDYHSMREHDRIFDRIREEYNKSDYSKSEWWQQIVPSEYKEGTDKIRERPLKESDLYEYTLKIDELGQEENFQTFFYQIYPMEEREKNILEKAGEEREINLYRPPSQLQEKPDNYSLPGPDVHYGKEAQVLLSNKLTYLIRENYIGGNTFQKLPK